MFDHLPLAAVIYNSTFCCHGGIPRIIEEDPDWVLHFNSNTPRPLKFLESGSIENDLLWSDIAEEEQEEEMEGDAF